MTALGFDQIANLGKERVAERTRFIGENETPLWNHFNSRKKEALDEWGKRYPMITQRPGGHNFYGQGAADFRPAIPMDSDSMRVYPVWYEIAHQLNGSTLRALKGGNETALINYRRDIGILTDTAKKRLNQTLHGDGTAAIAVCGSVITTTGAATLTCLTLATSAAGQAETKGATALDRNGIFAVINSSTNAIKAIFTVTTPASIAPTVNVTVSNANTASGDPIVDLSYSTSVSCYKKAPAGLRSLLAPSGIVQNVNRADFPQWKTPRVNGNDLPITPYMFKTAKTYVNIAANDMGDIPMSRLIIMTPGQHAMLCIQQFGYRRYEGNETVKGVAGKYVDDDGDTILFDADGAEDRVYLADGNSLYLGEEKSFGLFDEDSLELRMLLGVNGVGSDSFFMAIGWGGNLIKDVSQSTMQRDCFIDRISQTDVAQQTSL